MKKSKIIFWVATTILILWEAVMPVAALVFAPQHAYVGTQALGYPHYFASALMVCKVLGIIAISFPMVPATLKEWTYAGLTFNLIFAFISHAFVDQNIGYMLMPLVFLGILAVSYRYSKKIQQKDNSVLAYA